MVLEESSLDIMDGQKDKQVGPRENKAWNITRGKTDKIKAILLQVHHEKAGFFEKHNNAGNNRKQQEQRESKYEMD